MTAPSTSRQAIVLSGWGWRTNGTPERMALALARAGWRVLYCENPSSLFRHVAARQFTPADNIGGFRPKFLGHKFNSFPVLRGFQARLFVRGVLEKAREMGLKEPLVLYPDGDWALPAAREWKAQGFFTVYLNADHLKPKSHEALAAISDLSLVIPRINYDVLKQKFGDKVLLLPQLGPDLTAANGNKAGDATLTGLQEIPRPRLGYLGAPANTVDVGLLSEVLAAHPEWHFLSSGPLPALQRPNVHNIGWLEPAVIPRVVALLDVGFMPYNLRNRQILNGVPLKLFDYFAAGLPVVSTPLLHLREYGELIYFGESPDQLAHAVQRALAEMGDDPRREGRRRIAHSHSLDTMSAVLPEILLQRWQNRRTS